MSLFNFVDFVGPTVPASYLNSLDQIRNALNASLGGAVTLAPISATGVPGATALSLAQSGLITLSGGLTVGGGAFTSRGITDNATSTQLVLQPSGGISMGGAADPGAGSLNLANSLQVLGIPTATGVGNNTGLFGGAFSTSEQYCNTPIAIAANSISTGATFRIKMVGVCTSSVANTVTFQARLGPAGTIADTALFSFAFAAATSGTNIGWAGEFSLTFITVGATTSGCANGILLNAGNTGIYTNTTIAGPSNWVATGATNVASKLGISLKTGAATTSLTVYVVTAERVF